MMESCKADVPEKKAFMINRHLNLTGGHNNDEYENYENQKK